jgi:heme/copper-type cytochrome/quinol oxidase subunit 1
VKAGATARRAPVGLVGWVSDTSGEATGLRFIVTGLAFFGLAGVAALLIRVQLAVPNGSLFSPEAFDQLFSLHGNTMMFIFAVPVMLGIALRFIPRIIGARELALPRLAAFAFWLYLFAAATLWGSFVFGEAPNSGWFNYPPLASPRYQPGSHADVYAGTVLLAELAMIAGAISLIATILTRRARGMGIHLMPLIAWATLIASLMVVMAMPPVIVAVTMLAFDSKLGTAFFDAASGGDPVLWQHLFWFFGHPLVYLMLLPGLGIVSSVTPTFSRHVIVGYPLVAASYVAIGVISFMVWVHHMFATPTADAGKAAFSVATMAVAVPSGIHVFAVLVTMWRGRVRLEPPLLFVLGFVAIFVMGGISGVAVGSISADQQYTDTYFVVAHLHGVLIGGVLMPVLAAVHYWYPKVTGWMPGRRLGIASFVAIFTGVVVAFVPMHVTGLRGMPRRVWTYPEGLGWDGLNLVSTIGAFLIAAGVLLVLTNLVGSLGRRRAGPDPWGAGTLEWAPAPPPRVTSRYPLWEQPEEVGRGELVGPPARPSPMPFAAAAFLAMGVVGLIFDPLLLGAGLALCFVAVVEWLRPEAGTRPDPDALRCGVTSGLVALFVAIGSLILSWYYLSALEGGWPIPPVEAPSSWWGVALTVTLGGCAGCVLVGVRRRAPAWLACGAAAALLFVALVAAQLVDLDYTQAQNASASVAWTIWISTALLVLVLAGMAGVAAAWTRRDRTPPSGLAALTLYGGFIAASWPLVVFTLYVAPRL